MKQGTTTFTWAAGQCLTLSTPFAQHQGNRLLVIKCVSGYPVGSGVEKKQHICAGVLISKQVILISRVVNDLMQNWESHYVPLWYFGNVLHFPSRTLAVIFFLESINNLSGLALPLFKLELLCMLWPGNLFKAVPKTVDSYLLVLKVELTSLTNLHQKWVINIDWRSSFLYNYI